MSDYEMKGQQTKGAGNRYKAMNSYTYTHKEAEHWVGGNLPNLSEIVFDYCLEQGLKSNMTLLDFGCGCLRCSAPLIAYLDTGHYFGMDGDTGLIGIAKEKVKTLNLEEKQPVFGISWNLEFEVFGRPNFDFIFSQGVICHMPNEEIQQLLLKIKNFLSSTGQAHLSYISGENKNYKEGVFEQTFEELSGYAQAVGLQAVNQGQWDHPRKLNMLKLTLNM